MKAVSGTQMRGLDRRTITEAGISGERLMKIAGLRAAAGILENFSAGLPGEAAPKFCILAGKGNNGGDAFVVAEMLANADYMWETAVSAFPGGGRPRGGDCEGSQRAVGKAAPQEV